jgi:Transglutaminase-like superfamily
MSYYFFRSYSLLIRAEITLRIRGFKRIYNAVRALPTRQVDREAQIPYERLSQAMDLACVFYPKTVLCLQRSIATVFLLRSYGWPAELVNGCDIGTFENHAWAELFDQVVSDKPYMHEMYQVIDRC